MNLDRNTTKAFAASWASAWNAHDVDAVLSHFAEDAVFASPVAAQLLPETAGVLRGKAAIHAYWTLAAKKVPDFHVTVSDVYTGVDTMVINYRNQVGARVCEVLTFRDGQVIAGTGTYLVDDASGATGIAT